MVHPDRERHPIAQKFDDAAFQLQQTGDFSVEFTPVEFAKLLKKGAVMFHPWATVQLKEATIARGLATLSGHYKDDRHDTDFTIKLVDVEDGNKGYRRVIRTFRDPGDSGIDFTSNASYALVVGVVTDQIHKRHPGLLQSKHLSTKFMERGTLQISSVNPPESA
ncbi:hypothetical protein A3A64_03890 [Candidatus Gottesmanbacteria bacterium RIFCSPLOWO2_01_FULL_48_11]|uniref:Uncharacterized protein n=2 Tax=Candidatus Gottesmaniibacteriota TaxID=1752720 RepID=A0A0G1U0S8_9BACT|nr:MAG: hypothetical protein UY16_C0020G0003 [Candidatus Gottesmanbacteria bacterium GW2011_GWA2_47_9]OGG27498.1 MAG: hypothetical protein A3A64_03890 [Candidatus Gottesmanbacteria bacterium RIFCSPLOWO2_01_FULL_48_11]